MAIHTKVGILTEIPGASASVTSGLIDGLYADFLTKEFDFLDDSRMYPQDEWFTADPMTYIGTNNWEDLGSSYRQWQDNRYAPEFNYWLKRQDRLPIQPQNFVQDPAIYSNNWNGSSPIEFIRLVYPAPNGDFNIPYPNPRGSEHSAFHNPSRPLKHSMIRFTLPLIDMAFKTAFGSLSYYLENQSWVDGQAPDTMSNRIDKYREAKNQLSQIMHNVAGGYTSIEDAASDIAAKKEEILNFDYEANNPNPWSDERYRFMWGDGTNPVEGAESNTIHQVIGFGDGNNYMTNHPLGTMPFEVLPGVTMSNILPAITQISKAPAVGNPGDIITIENDGVYAWDPQNQEWSTGFYYRFLSPFMNRMQQRRDEKVNRVRDLSFMRNFTFAALHIPAFSLSTNGEVVK